MCAFFFVLCRKCNIVRAPASPINAQADKQLPVPSANIGNDVELVGGRHRGRRGTSSSAKSCKTVFQLFTPTYSICTSYSSESLFLALQAKSNVAQAPASPIDAQADEQSPVPSALKDNIGKDVEIVGGKHRGKRGTLIEKKRNLYYIKVSNDPPNIVQVAGPSIKLAHGGTLVNRRSALPAELQGKPVQIRSGRNKGKSGKLIGKEHHVFVVQLPDGSEVTAAGPSLQFPNGDAVVAKFSRPRKSAANAHGSRRSARLQKTRTEKARAENSEAAAAWHVRNHNDGGFTIGGRKVSRIRFQSKREKPDVTLLATLLGRRVLIGDQPLSGDSDEEDLPLTLDGADMCGKKCELISIKLYDDPDSSSIFQKPKVARMMFAQTAGPGLEPFAVSDFLLQIADFSRLNPRKICARLELLQSPSKRQVVFDIRREYIKAIPDHGNYQGCGFVSDQMMYDILIKSGMSITEANKVCAIQVRMLIPSLGLCKGVLVRKLIPHGPQLLVPQSMIKVPASTRDSPIQDKVAILICKNGEFPSDGSANEYIGRALAGGDPPQKSFKSKIHKPLSDMICRLWKSMAVPERVFDKYKTRALEPDGRRHAWVAGVSDMTDKLPPDAVFVTGMKDRQPSDIFVTRSPCTKYEDGRVLSCVTEKPADMSDAEWVWLGRLPFGCIVFSNPRPGRMSIPERIASGDLDGDLYLVCWDEVILKHMHADPLPDRPMKDDGVLRREEANANWFEDTQKLMVDSGLINDVGKLTGKLYNLGKKAADKSAMGLRHNDAKAFFTAYNCALEFKKHGRPIELPRRLHSELDPRFHHFLTVPRNEQNIEN